LAAARAVGIPAALDLLQLPFRFGSDVALGDVETCREIPVDENVWGGAVGDGAESQFGLPGHADLAHEYDIEWCIKRLVNLETDRNAAPRQGQEHRPKVFEVGQLPGETASGVTTIGVLHVPASQRLPSTLIWASRHPPKRAFVDIILVE